MPKKENIPVKPVMLMIEVPKHLRKGFWKRPNNALHYWAFKNRPRAFVEEKIIFTFNRKPVAQAVVLKIEGPGHGEGEYKHWHKVYWNPSHFQKFKGVTASEPKIEKLTSQDIPAVMEAGQACFPKFEFDGIARESLHGDFSQSYVVKDGDKVVGAYLLAPNQLPEVFPGKETKAYQGKKGIEGVALFLLPQYRGAGVGRKLRGMPLTLNYDYIWGQHFEDLSNLQNWVNFGRTHLFTYKDLGGGDVHITVMDLKSSKTADHNLEVGEGETYWAGEGNAASGILPICPQTGNVCLAMRSEHVMTPGVWGTIGGAVQKGLSPAQSAKAELKEETGYGGGMTLIPAFVFTDRGFSYHNFIGVVSSQFSFAPKPFSAEHIEELKAQLTPKQYYQLEPGWETDHIVWLPYAEVVADMEKHPGDYHPGMHKLFADSREKIEKALGVESQEQPEPQEQEQQPKQAAQTLLSYLKLCTPNIARHAQQIYDAWDQNEAGEDEEYGGGGICDAISEEIIDIVISAQPFRLNAQEGGQEGDDHSWVVVSTDTEVYGVDIPHGLYERGGGYNWKKVPGVQFQASDVEIWKIDIDPAEFNANMQASWVKKAAGFAFRSFKKLWHVGDMNVKSKQPGSLEGSGLSVSIHPEDWMDIAEIGGDTWELTKPSNRFLNFHRLSKPQRKQLAAWGIQNGYLTEVANAYRWVYWDSEAEEERYIEFPTQEEAEAEMEGMGEGGKVVPVKSIAYAGTDKLKQRTNNPSGDQTAVAFDLLVTVYAEEQLDCDGVWWEDTYDPANLSAPRGVIFPSKLSSWKARKVQTAAFDPSWMKPWMTGDCWLFALALSHHMPNAKFVGLATEHGVVHHVGLYDGGKYYDVRGAMTGDEFNYAQEGDSEKPMHEVPMDYEQVMRDGEYGSWLGHEDEFNMLPDMKRADKAVRRVFPKFSVK
jgi:8-oxo-dGTP pyrophosphatase MutT (NUDIX family)/GNAT superfamily N-acetyltransferase